MVSVPVVDVQQGTSELTNETAYHLRYTFTPQYARDKLEHQQSRCLRILYTLKPSHTRNDAALLVYPQSRTISVRNVRIMLVK